MSMLCMGMGWLVWLATSGGAGQDAAPVGHEDRLAARLEAVRAELIELRRDLHRYPEVSGQEERTAAVVAEALRALDLEVREKVGGHGVVALLRGSKPGPVVAFRADMDAVASGAPDPVPFRSEVPGVRHICGHDIHTTVGIALAHALHAVRDEWAGTVMLVFQPAEENATGARAMLADGAFDDPEPEVVFAFHCYPAPVGTIGSTRGLLLAGRDSVRVALSGSGDLRKAARQTEEILTNASTIEITDPAALVTGEFVVARLAGSHAGPGDAPWTVEAVLTTSGAESSAGARAQIEAGLRESLPDGVSHELTYEERFISGVHNDPALLESTLDAIRSVVGDGGVTLSEGVPPTFSEDFGFFLDHAPGVMYWLGVSNPEKGTLGMPHSPDFVADEEAIFVGARAMAAVLLERLRTE